MLTILLCALRRAHLLALLVAAVAWCCAACDPKPATPSEPSTFTVVPKVNIEPDQARDLVIARYTALFGALYLRDPLSGDYRHLAPLQRSDLREVETEGSAWMVRCNRLAGFHLSARVAKDGSWVELIDVGYATH